MNQSTTKIEPKPTVPEPDSHPLLWLFYSLVTAPVGFPMWLFGVITGVDRLQRAWGDSTRSLLHLFRGGKSSHSAALSVSDYHQVPLEGGNLLNLCRCVDDYTLRFIRHVDEQGYVQRIDLSMIVPGELEALGLPDTMDSAVAYTMRQIRQGILQKVSPLDLPAVTVMPPATEPTTEAPAAEVAAPASPAREVPVPVEPAAKAAKPITTEKGVVGKVLLAQLMEFPARSPRDKPYSSFTVRLQTDDGQETVFSGVDLESRFTGDDAFRKGDRVRIERLGKQQVEVVEEGKRVFRQRNCFRVTSA